ncbi:Band 7 domain [Dillenia turbinata]|uniref:Prohibitin n=1 Tax=Dillenia turbinata TaxID=194707 RepID=A0AAN8UGX3_9MAGN
MWTVVISKFPQHSVAHRVRVYPEGTHLIIPWFERPVLTRSVPDKLPTIFWTLGKDYNERVLPSLIHETLKAVVAQYNARQLLTERCHTRAVSREIQEHLTKRAAGFHIELDDLTSAIEAKQVAAQEAESARYIVEKAEQEKKSAIIKAQGEANSAQLLGEAIAKNPASLTLIKIEKRMQILSLSLTCMLNLRY